MKKILLVDDSRTMLLSMMGVLKRAGFDVLTALNAEQALDKIPNFKPDLMITDLNMPGMDGISLIRTVKSQRFMRFKPILMLTTESQGEKRNQAKSAGATGWLVKPVKPSDLIAIVKQVMPGS